MKQFQAKDLTTEEKLRLICAAECWRTDHLGGKIPQICATDGPVGVRKTQTQDGHTGTKPSVAYPSLQSLANTWNTDLARVYGEALADDCIESDSDILLGPGVNIKRTPMNGRNFEYFSEDPYLAGTMAREYIFGLQSMGVGACLKHFCCNNAEYNRFNQSSEVDERTLREIYYKPFEIACEAKPVSVMSSYNRVNGTLASEYKKGFEVLRGEFGFDGAIFSDWDAIRNRARAAEAGCDLEFPDRKDHYEELLRDYADGKLSDEALDACVERVLTLVYRVRDMAAKRNVSRSQEERLQASKAIAEESMVLLKNDGGVLPLRKGGKITVCGAYAKGARQDISGGGSAAVVPLCEGFDLPALLSERLGGEVIYDNAFFVHKVIGSGEIYCNPDKVLQSAAVSDVCVICAGTGGTIESESFDRESMKLPAVQERAILEAAKVNENVVVVLFAGAAIDMSAWIDKVKGVVYAGFCGEKGGEALADILCGAANPSGKLSETFMKTYADSPASRVYADSCVTCYEEGLNVGYRYFDRHEEGVLFPFGHGLSYSEFDYGNLCVQPNENGGAEVKFTVKNLSSRDGKETAQVYVSPIGAKVYRPLKELKGYKKTLILAGESEEVSIDLDISAFSYYSVSKNKWQVDDGLYKIVVAASAADVRLSAYVKVQDGKIVLS